MKKSNEEKIKSLVTQIMEICKEEKEQSLTVGISGDLVSVWGSLHKLKNKRIDLFSNDRGKTWTDMR